MRLHEGMTVRLCWDGTHGEIYRLTKPPKGSPRKGGKGQKRTTRRPKRGQHRKRK
jgi:hypothetical protein